MVAANRVFKILDTRRVTSRLIGTIDKGKYKKGDIELLTTLRFRLFGKMEEVLHGISF